MKPQRVSGAAFARRACARAGAGGADPFLGLAKALTEEAHGEGVGLPELLAPGQDAAALAAHLRDAKGDPGYTFGGALGRLTESLRKEGRILGYETAKLVLVIDQLEELFTVAAITPEVRRAFVGLLGGLARSGHVWVIATLRADFWPLVAEMPELVALAEGDGRLDLAPPSLAEQAEIIRKPAAAAGLNFEVHSHAGVGLDATLAEHAAAAPGVLPLLSFTLDELYRDARRRGEDVLTYASYEALGGLQGAIAKRAEEVAAALPPAAQAALPSVLRALATTSNLSDAIAVSRSAALAEFPAGSPARQLVDAMIAARLLIAEGGDAAPTVRLAHEALIARWRRAADQLASDRRDLETRALAEEQFNRWRNAGRSTSWLLRNPDLANAVDLNARWGDELRRRCATTSGSRADARASARPSSRSRRRCSSSSPPAPSGSGASPIGSSGGRNTRSRCRPRRPTASSSISRNNSAASPASRSTPSATCCSAPAICKTNSSRRASRATRFA